MLVAVLSLVIIVAIEVTAVVVMAIKVTAVQATAATKAEEPAAAVAVADSRNKSSVNSSRSSRRYDKVLPGTAVVAINKMK